jgi:tripartite-type tricarboxylate transporter receptor subunit TctC
MTKRIEFTDGGKLAAAAAVTSPPDGYTLLFVAPNNAISTSLYKKLPYDFIRDTAPVAGHHAAHQHDGRAGVTPGQNRSGIYRLLQGQPRQGLICVFGQRHVGAYVGGAVQGPDKGRNAHVPYRGSAIAYPDLISNKVQVLFDNLPAQQRVACGPMILIRQLRVLRLSGIVAAADCWL